MKSESSLYTGQQLRESMRNHLVELQPYAMVTLCLNQKTASPEHAEHLLRGHVKNIILRADTQYLGTRHVTRRPQHERFEGIGFFEKLNGYPHIHILMFSPLECTSPDEEERLRFLLRHLPTDATRFRLEDRGAFEDYFDRQQCASESIVSNYSGNLQCHVTSIYDVNGIADYATKCYNNTGKFIILSELSSHHSKR